jgi:hypothetical protein
VVLHDDNLGGFKTIEVADNGHGIPYPDAEDLFSRLGGSWKQGGHRSHEKRRILHGKEGRGRFRAFALGRVVDWHVCYVASEGLRAYRIAHGQGPPETCSGRRRGFPPGRVIIAASPSWSASWTGSFAH